MPRITSAENSAAQNLPKTATLEKIGPSANCVDDGDAPIGAETPFSQIAKVETIRELLGDGRLTQILPDVGGEAFRRCFTQTRDVDLERHFAVLVGNPFLGFETIQEIEHVLKWPQTIQLHTANITIGSDPIVCQQELLSCDGSGRNSSSCHGFTSSISSIGLNAGMSFRVIAYQ
jgi:hypothetical protein